MDYLDVIKKFFGKNVANFVGLVMVVAGLVWGLPKVAVSPDKLAEVQEKQSQALQKSEQLTERQLQAIQWQIWDDKVNSIETQIYQLKGLKKKKLADEDDLERLETLKKLKDSLTIKKDSLYNILFMKGVK